MKQFSKLNLLVGSLLAFVSHATPVHAATIRFQEDVETTVDGVGTGVTYTSTQDTYTDGTFDNANNAGTFVIGGAKVGLVRFENIFGAGAGQIPAGSTIVSASLTFVKSFGSSAISYGQLDPSQTWTEHSLQGTFSGGNGIQFGSDAILLGTVTFSPGQTDVSSSLSAWSANPLLNNGWGFTSGGNTGWASSDNPTVANHPVLTVVIATAPVLSSPTSNVLSTTTADLGGNVTSDGDSAITERGVVFSVTGTNNDPLIGGTGVTQLTSPGTTGVFTVNATTLSANSDYSFKAYAINAAGTTYTTPVSTFTTSPPDYLVTTTGNAIVITDVSGNSDTLAVSEPVAGSIEFAAAGRHFSVDSGPTLTGASGNIALTWVTSITVNAAGGNDIVNVGAFVTALNGLTINGGTGTDAVNMNGSITFASDASLDADLFNDDASPGTDSIAVAASANLITSGIGSITLKATGAVSMAAGSSVESVNGGIAITSTASGLSLTGATVTTSGIGNVSLTGTGVGDGGGISISGASVISSTGTGLAANQGLLTLLGSGSGFGTGTTLAGASSVASVDGAISITGFGNAGASNRTSKGIVVSDSTVQSTGTATVNLIGKGNSATFASDTNAQHHGIQVTGATALITSAAGKITLDGDGRFGRSSNNFGVVVQNGAGVTGTGTTVVELIGITRIASGLGSNGNGIVITDAGSRVTTVSGNLVLTGTGADQASSKGVVITTAGQVASTSGSITITGGYVGGGTGTGPGILYDSATAIATSGTINLASGIGVGARMSLSNGSISGTAGVTVKAGAGVTIDLGSTTDTDSRADLSDAELDLITTSGTLSIGDANSGAITLSTAISRTASTIVILNSGSSIAINTGALDTAGGNLVVNPGGATNTFSAAASGTDVSMSTTGTLSFGSGDKLAIHFSNSTTADTLTVVGKVDLTGALPAFTGSAPDLANSFTIIDNDGTDAITGTFTGLAEGALVSVNGVNKKISYVGGTGNDVVLITPNATPVVDNPIPNQTATVGTPFSFTFAANTFSDPDIGQTLSYSTGPRPAWLSFNPATRTFSGTPANGDAGTVTVNVIATDDGAPPSSNNTTFGLAVLSPPLPLDSVALTGSQAPGLAAGVTFNYFGDLSLNSSGQTAMYGRVSGPGITAANDAGIWILDGAGFNLMLREGDSVGVAGQTITEPIRHGRITDTGVTHLITGVKGTGVTTANNVIGWVDDGTSTRQYTRKGTTFSNLFNGVSEHTATDEGYFAGQLKAVSGSVTAATDTGIWKVNADGTTAVAIREGTVIGGTTKLGNLMNRVAVGSGGFGVYASYLTGVPAANNRAVIKQNFGSAGAPVLVAFSGVANSTTGVANGMFNTFQSESVNASGETAFMAYMKTGVGGVTSADDWGLWRETGGGLQLMLREGQQAPGRPAGAVFHILSQHWLLDDGGMVVLATLRGTNVTSANSTGIWHIDTAGVVSVLLGTGEALPAAVAGGSTVAGFYLRPDVSPAGNYAAVVTLVPGTGDTTSANNLMLLSGNAGTPGVYDLQARRGTIYQVGAGTKTIRNIILGFFTGANGTTTGGSGGMSRIINDGGQVAAWLQFTDGTSGPFISPAL